MAQQQAESGGLSKLLFKENLNVQEGPAVGPVDMNMMELPAMAVAEAPSHARRVIRRLAVAVAAACWRRFMSFFVITHRGEWPAAQSLLTQPDSTQPVEMLRTWSRTTPANGSFLAPGPAAGFKTVIEAPLKMFCAITEPGLLIRRSYRSASSFCMKVRETGAALGGPR